MDISRTALFLLRVDVELRRQDPQNAKASLLLRIRPDQIRSLTLEDPFQTSTGSGAPQDLASVCLRFELTSPMDLVAPEPRLRPKKRDQISILHTIMHICQQTAFKLHLQDQTGLEHRLHLLCEAVSRNELRPKDMSAELRTYYRGQGGHVIDIGPLFAQHDIATQSPPAYGDLGNPPPMPPIHEKPIPNELGLEGAPSTKRRRLDSTVDAPESSGLDRLAEIISTQMNKIEERMMAQMAETNKRMDDRMARMEERFLKLEGRMGDRMAKMEDCIITRLDQRLGDVMRDGEKVEKKTDELEAEVEDLRGEIQAVDERLNREVESEVEDQMTAARWELKEYVEEQIGDAVGTIKGEMADGDIVVEGTVRISRST
ncbi:phosphatidylethanolamine N-methyltransferase [Cytospora paraplurivora]|uniref:Phosphatidylethanolamine N-methyltransferase n=1 Tax=Cytospora paraplurivora TaxID=2898453 RepID=A0AAN9TZC2_9PEZI